MGAIWNCLSIGRRAMLGSFSKDPSGAGELGSDRMGWGSFMFDLCFPLLLFLRASLFLFSLRSSLFVSCVVVLYP